MKGLILQFEMQYGYDQHISVLHLHRINLLHCLRRLFLIENGHKVVDIQFLQAYYQLRNLIYTFVNMY